MSSSSRSTPTNYLYYFALLATFGLGIWLILSIGSGLKPKPTGSVNPNTVVSVQNTEQTVS